MNTKYVKTSGCDYCGKYPAKVMAIEDSTICEDCIISMINLNDEQRLWIDEACDLMLGDGRKQFDDGYGPLEAMDDIKFKLQASSHCANRFYRS